jgi:hypothetical protein
MGTIGMLEDLNLLIYVALGFVISYLALEGGWHFTACRIKDKSIPPCVFKQVKTLVISSSKRT